MRRWHYGAKDDAALFLIIADTPLLPDAAAAARCRCCQRAPADAADADTLIAARS